MRERFGHTDANARKSRLTPMTREQIARAQDMAKDCIAKNYKNCD
jgi:hypothetical protein